MLKLRDYTGLSVGFFCVTDATSASVAPVGANFRKTFHTWVLFLGSGSTGIGTTLHRHASVATKGKLRSRTTTATGHCIDFRVTGLILGTLSEGCWLDAGAEVVSARPSGRALFF
jgi:hypothetical protein